MVAIFISRSSFELHGWRRYKAEQPAVGNLQGATEPVDAIFYLGKVAGVVGFEPTVHATKKRCLTAWLHPNCEGVYDALAR